MTLAGGNRETPGGREPRSAAPRSPATPPGTANGHPAHRPARESQPDRQGHHRRHRQDPQQRLMHPNRPAVAMPSGTPAGDTRQSRVGDRHLERGGVGDDRPALLAGGRRGTGSPAWWGRPRPQPGHRRCSAPPRTSRRSGWTWWPSTTASTGCRLWLAARNVPRWPMSGSPR